MLKSTSTLLTILKYARTCLLFSPWASSLSLLLQSSTGAAGHNAPTIVAHGTDIVTRTYERRRLLLEMLLIFLSQLNTVHGHIGEVDHDRRRDQMMIHV